MTDQVLDILKLALLGLLYLFFARVVWTVWSEVRPADTRTADGPTPGRVRSGASGALAAARHHKTGIPVRLVIVEPKKRKGSTFEIDSVVSIGREADNTITITGDAFVSNHHARVWRADGMAMIDDRGSRNGTFVNGDRLVDQHPLHTGDRIQIGYTILEARE